MIKLFPILLLENPNIFQITCLLKNYKSINKSEILDQIRAVPYVIRVKIQDDDRLYQIGKGHDYEYTLLKIKYLNVYEKASKGIEMIEAIVKNGREDFHKIEGVIKLAPLHRSLKRIK